MTCKTSMKWKRGKVSSKKKKKKHKKIMCNYFLKMQKFLMFAWSTCENRKHLPRLAKAMEFHPVIYVALSNPQLAEGLNKKFQLQGLKPRICDTVQKDDWQLITAINKQNPRQPHNNLKSYSTIRFTTLGNENTYEFFASFMFFPHFMLKVFTFFALFLEFKFLHKTRINRSLSPCSYSAEQIQALLLRPNAILAFPIFLRKTLFYKHK